MAVTQIQHMGVGQVSILIDFVGVVSCDASLRSKGKLGDYIMDTVWVSGCVAGLFG